VIPLNSAHVIGQSCGRAFCPAPENERIRMARLLVAGATRPPCRDGRATRVIARHEHRYDPATPRLSASISQPSSDFVIRHSLDIRH
jgi:hypothetical protein